MLKRAIKTKMIISLASVIILLPIIANSAAVFSSGKEVRHTAKITFFKNNSGDLIAEIIPTTSNGYFPRTGWTICEIMASDIKNVYSEKIKDVKRVKGYFVVTYKIIEKDKYSVIPMYKGELLKLEPWQPPFAKS